MRRTCLTAFAPCALTILLAACALPRYEAGVEMDDPRAEARLLEQLRLARPAAFRLQHRALLAVRGRRVDFLGYVLWRGPDDWRWQGLGEMGGTLFDLAMEDGRPRVVRKAPGLPDRLLVQGLAGDLAHLFAVPPNPTGLFARGEKRVALVFEDDGALNEVVFAADDASPALYPAASLDVRDGRVVRRAAYGEWKPIAGDAAPLAPTRIDLTNLAGGYALTLWPLRLESPERKATASRAHVKP